MQYVASVLICGLLLFSSCGNPKKSEVKSTYPSGAKKVVFLLEEVGDEEYIKKGERHYYEDGTLELEGFYDGKNKRQGRWKYWYPDGSLWSICEYKSGNKHGISKVYYENGKLRYEGKYVDDEKTGEWKFYNKSGDLTDRTSH